MMNERDKIRCDLSAYLDGELDPARSAEVAAALASDADLSRQFEELRRVRELVADVPKLSADDDFVDAVLAKARAHKRGPNFYRFAAAAGVVIVACGALLVSILNTTQPSADTPEKISINQPGGIDERLEMADLDMDIDVEDVLEEASPVKVLAKKAKAASLGDDKISPAISSVSDLPEKKLEEIRTCINTSSTPLKEGTYKKNTSELDKKAEPQPSKYGFKAADEFARKSISGVDVRSRDAAPVSGSGGAVSDAESTFGKSRIARSAPAGTEPEVETISVEPYFDEPEKEISRAKSSITLAEHKKDTSAKSPVPPAEMPVLCVPEIAAEPKPSAEKPVPVAKCKKLGQSKKELCCCIEAETKPKPTVARKGIKKDSFQAQLTQARIDNTAVIVTDDLKRDKARVEKLIVSNSIQIVPPAKSEEKLILNQARNVLPKKPQQYEYVLFATSDRLAGLKQQIVKDFGSPENRSRSRQLRNQLVQNFDLPQQLELRMPTSQETIVRGRGLSAFKGTMTPTTKEVMIITIQAKSQLPMMIPASQTAE